MSLELNGIARGADSADDVNGGGDERGVEEETGAEAGAVVDLPFGSGRGEVALEYDYVGE